MIIFKEDGWKKCLFPEKLNWTEQAKFQGIMRLTGMYPGQISVTFYVFMDKIWAPNTKISLQWVFQIPFYSSVSVSLLMIILYETISTLWTPCTVNHAPAPWTNVGHLSCTANERGMRDQQQWVVGEGGEEIYFKHGCWSMHVFYIQNFLNWIIVMLLITSTGVP